jgi:hypothetical protein
MTIGFAMLIAGAALAQAAEPVTRAAEPVSRLEGSITTDDYPDASLQAGEQGITSVEYVIGASGRVSPGSCKVTATSGHPRLDARTCQVIEKRFRFRPALNEGEPVASVRRQEVFWALPGEKVDTDLDDESVRMVRNIGACLAAKNPALARRIVDAPLGSTSQALAIASVNPRRLRCSQVARTKFPATQFTGAVAEALVMDKLGNRPVPPLGAVGPTPLTGTEGFAQCVVRRNPGNVRDLLATTPTGPAEAAAIRRIVPDLQPCIAAGTTLRFNKVAMRSLFALGLYRELGALGASSARPSTPR